MTVGEVVEMAEKFGLENAKNIIKEYELIDPNTDVMDWMKKKLPSIVHNRI